MSSKIFSVLSIAGLFEDWVSGCFEDDRCQDVRFEDWMSGCRRLIQDVSRMSSPA